MANMQSIGKFTDTVYDIKRSTYYVETLEDGTVIVDETRKLPTMDFTCTVKLHGTFSGVQYSKENGVEALSKSQVITQADDNAGFAKFVDNHKEYFEFYLKELTDTQDLDEVQLSGEWVGPKIQKGCGINLISDKAFVMFGIKFKQTGCDEYRWAQAPHEILRQIADTDFRIRSIFNFPHEEIEIDFNDPKEALQKLDIMRDAIEEECPVAKKMLQQEGTYNENIPLIGEGFVAVGYDYDGSRYAFKVKGDKHSSSSKNKQPKEVDPLQAKKLEVAEKVTPPWRLEQALTELGLTHLVMKDMGNVIKWVLSDIKKEEQRFLEESEMSLQDIQKFVSNIVRDWYKLQIEREPLG